MEQQQGLPAVIGDFTIKGLLGEGAMGRVFLAERQQPRREVALKVLSQVTEAGRRRFGRETEILARLEHPGIARLYSAGEALLGAAPVYWFEMERVQGRTLRDWCAAERPSLRERMTRMAQIARAVHHAHANGVIHRDLKPANILIDAEGRPRIVDFGVAQATGGAQEHSLTRDGQVLGTLPYMSWEQLVGEPLDARSDVYALGVIAYELAAGSLPLPALEGATLIAAIEQIRTRTPRRLDSRVPGVDRDLATIIHTALAREREARYGSALELASDLEHWLAHRPIAARAPTLTYTLRLAARRHRVASAAAAAVLTAILASTVVSWRFALAEAGARAQAELRLAESEALAAFLQDMLRSADPERSLGDELRVIDLLDAARLTAQAQSARPAAVSARIEGALGETYRGLGRYEAALELLESAVAHAAGGADGRLLAELRLAQAQTLNEAGRYAEAERIARELSADREPRRALAAGRVLGQALSEQRRYAEALPLLARVYADARATLGDDDPASLEAGHDYAAALVDAGRNEAARVAQGLAIHREVLAGRLARFGADHPQTLATRNALAGALFYARDAAAAEVELRAVLEARTRVLGAEHPLTLTSTQNVAAALIQQGQAEAGLGFAQTALRGLTRVFGAEHTRTLTVLNMLAWAQEDLGRIEAAEQSYRELLRVAERQQRRDEAEFQNTHNNLALLLMKSGRLDAARREFEAVHARALRTLGPQHVLTAIYAGHYGECLQRLGRHREALALHRNSLPLIEAEYGADHARTRLARERLAAAQAGV